MLVRSTRPGVMSLGGSAAGAAFARVDVRSPRSGSSGASGQVRESRRSDSRGSQASVGATSARTSRIARPSGPAMRESVRGGIDQIVPSRSSRRSRTLVPSRRLHCRTMATGTVTDAFLGAVRARLPDLRLLTDEADRESLPARRDGVSAGRAAGRRGAADRDRPGRRAGPALRRVRRPDRAARRRIRALGRRRRASRARSRSRSRAMDRILEIDAPNLCVVDPARRHQRPPQGGGRRARAVLRARPGELRDVLDRRQPRHQRRRAVLREVRRDPRLGPRARGRHGRRRRSIRTGGKNVKDVAGLFADPPDGRVAGHARADHRGDPPAPAGAAAARHAAGVLPDPRGGRRRGRRDRRRGAVAGHARADGPVHDPRGRRRPRPRARPRRGGDADDRVRPADRRQPTRSWPGPRRSASASVPRRRSAPRPRPRPTCCARRGAPPTGLSRRSAT